jgi:hypothetical protein
LLPSPYSWVHFTGHPHPYHDLKLHSLTMKASCRRHRGVTLDLPPKRLPIRFSPRSYMSSEELFPRMNVL